jgi:hypothetical protein
MMNNNFIRERAALVVGFALMISLFIYGIQKAITAQNIEQLCIGLGIVLLVVLRFIYLLRRSKSE